MKQMDRTEIRIGIVDFLEDWESKNTEAPTYKQVLSALPVGDIRFRAALDELEAAEIVETMTNDRNGRQWVRLADGTAEWPVQRSDTVIAAMREYNAIGFVPHAVDIREKTGLSRKETKETLNHLRKLGEVISVIDGPNESWMNTGYVLAEFPELLAKFDKRPTAPKTATPISREEKQIARLLSVGSGITRKEIRETIKKTRIGDWVICDISYGTGNPKRTSAGKVIGKFPNLCQLDNGYTVPWKDMAIHYRKNQPVQISGRVS